MPLSVIVWIGALGELDRRILAVWYFVALALSVYIFVDERV